MKRCEVGMLAWINTSWYAENIGVVVKIEAPSTAPDCDWLISSSSPLLGAAASNVRPIVIPPGLAVVNARDCDLTPITPRKRNVELIMSLGDLEQRVSA
jgi:hypothetical protein